MNLDSERTSNLEDEFTASPLPPPKLMLLIYLTALAVTLHDRLTVNDEL
jgi:hypothetical protein